MVKKQMFSPSSASQGLLQHGSLQPNIQKARAGDIHFLANLRDVQFGQHVRGQLARIHFARLGQRHQGVALVIAKFGIGTGAHQYGGDVRIRQNGMDGCVQGEFYFFMRQHGEDLTTDEHR